MVLSCSQPPNLSLPPFLLFMRTRFHSGHMFWRRYPYSHTHTQPHIHELVFSLCPYALPGVVLLLCCSQTGPFTTAPATRLKQSYTHAHTHTHTTITATRTGLPLPQSITHPFTHTYTPTIVPSLTKLLLLGSSYGPCVTLGPLCVIRCYNQTTKAL